VKKKKKKEERKKERKMPKIELFSLLVLYLNFNKRLEENKEVVSVEA
jgi:hypothetical protein